MAYRNQREANGKTALVIDGWEKGIASSPYTGITSLKNLTTSYYAGVAYVEYKRQAATISGGTMTKPMFDTQSPVGLIYILDDSQQVWKQSSPGSTTFNLLSGNPSTAGTGNGMAYWQGYLVVFRGTAIDICGDGTGDGGITSSNWNTGVSSSGVWPIAGTTLTLTGSPVQGDTSATISTYTDAQGTARSFWNGPNGFYQLTFGNGQVTKGTLTQGSASITWSPALYSNSGSASVTVTPVFSGQHQAFVSPSDGNLYFCNGQYVGVLRVNTVAGYINAVKGVMNTFVFDYGVVRIQNETIGWIDQLFSNLVIAGIKSLYLWDRTSAAVQAPISMSENIIKIKNVLNIIYVFAGYKGNIYQTNGYSLSLLKKVPDGFFGLIDPYLQWGGVMAHRNKLYFQVYASTNTGTGTASGIFSIEVIAGQLPGALDTSGAMIMENQNSFGYTVTATSSQNGVLVDYPTATNDSYYSAWYNNSAGGIDFNNTTLYQNYEPAIETDIIPIGSFLDSRTFENIEYKLDKPLANGDSIRLSYRTQSSGSYTLVGNSEVTGIAGTTTATSDVSTQVLADNFNSNIQNAQWIQFLIEFKCAASNSSFIRLRQIMLHYM